jgi:hypothetical protein
MSYGDDFATVDTAGAPLDPVIMIGADPMFWGAVLLALAVAAMIGWLLAGGSRSRRNDAAGPIWDAIDDAAKAAMKADTEALPAHASHLHRVLRARLGKTLDFGGGLSRCVDALDLAIKGEVEHGGGRAGPDHATEDETPATNHEPDAPAASAANVTVTINPPPGHGAHGAAKHGKRPMTTRERNHALRLAVADFNDYWRHRSAREAEMRAVIVELCDPGPPRPRLSHGGDHH